MDDVGQPTLTVKVVGHQWYWSYEVVAASEDNLVLGDDVSEEAAPVQQEVLKCTRGDGKCHDPN